MPPILMSCWSTFVISIFCTIFLAPSFEVRVLDNLIGRLIITGDWLFHPPIHSKMGGVVITSLNDTNDKQVDTQ